MSVVDKGTEGLNQRQADVLGRQFNSALMNTTAYGSSHSVTRRACDIFVDTVATVFESLDSLDSVTLLLDRGTLFVEEYSLDGKFNPTRIARVFRALGLQSVTFQSGVDVDALVTVLNMLSTHDEYAGVEALKTELETREISSIRLNHVVMRKFTEGEEVIDREGLEQLTNLAERQVASGDAAPGASGPSPGASLMARVENIFSMRALLDYPDQVAGQVLARTWSDDDDGEKVAGRIRALRTELREHSRDAQAPVSMAEVMEAVARVRSELSEALAGQDEISRFMAEHGGQVLDEVEQLTFDTVLMIVQEEYRGGGVSVRRLAQVLRRVVPEARDLKRFLPLLKQGLIEIGMPLADYVTLVNELGVELHGDTLVHALQEGAESVGLSVEELVREIRSDPTEAARVLVLAAEFRRSDAPDQDRMSAVLADYIGRASDVLVESDNTAETNVGELRQALRQTQQKLVRQACEQGLDRGLGNRVDEALAAKVENSVDRIRIKRLLGRLADSDVSDETILGDALAAVFEQDTDLKRLGETLQLELEQSGYARETLQRVFERTERRLRSRSRLEMLPDGMLEPNVINYLLEREIAACRRFGTYFSVLLLMIARIRVAEGDADSEDDAGEWRPVLPEEIEQLLPQVFRALPPHVRDIDLLGSFGSRERNIPLVLLTMAHEEGAEIVRGRMLEALAEQNFTVRSGEVRIDTIAVTQRFDPDRTPDRKSFLNALQGELAQALVQRLHARD